MRFLLLAVVVLSLPAIGRADPGAVPYGEAKPAGRPVIIPVAAPPTPLPVAPVPVAVPPGGVAIFPPASPYSAPVLPPVVPPVGPAVILPDGGIRAMSPAIFDGTNRFGPGVTLAERFQYWSLVHNHAPDGTIKPVGAGNAWTEFKFAFGSARQFFGTAGATVGYGPWSRLP